MKVLTVVVFPGQGAYRPGLIKALYRNYPIVTSVLDEVNEATNGKLDGLLSGVDKRSAVQLAEGSPDILQLGIFAASIALWNAKSTEIEDGCILLGHSLGEVAALTCSVFFTPGNGARVVEARNTALSMLAPGVSGMLALNLDQKASEAVVCLANDPSLTIACINAPRQTVISGSLAALKRVEQTAQALRIPATAVAAPYAFHSPLMSKISGIYRQGLKAIPSQPFNRPVYSMLLNRVLTEADDIYQLLTDQLIQPVDMLSAMRALQVLNIGHVVECGASSAIGKLAQQTIPLRSVKSWGDLDEVSVDPVVLTTLDNPTDTGVKLREPEPRSGDSDAELRSLKHAGIEDILESLRDMYAITLDYPREAFEDKADLEADLGVDSLKQTMLLQQVVDKFGLQRNGAVRIADYPTLYDIAQVIMSQQKSIRESALSPSESPTDVMAGTGNTDAKLRSLKHTGIEDILESLRDMYATMLDYPREAFEDKADLEADLGVDSLKQTMLLQQVVDRFGLQRDGTVRIADHPTLYDIAQSIVNHPGNIGHG